MEQKTVYMVVNADKFCPIGGIEENRAFVVKVADELRQNVKQWESIARDTAVLSNEVEHVRFRSMAGVVTTWIPNAISGSEDTLGFVDEIPAKVKDEMQDGGYHYVDMDRSGLFFEFVWYTYYGSEEHAVQVLTQNVITLEEEPIRCEADSIRAWEQRVSQEENNETVLCG